MDLSNKSLALLLISAIVISLGGTIISLNKINPTGFATAAGNVSPTLGDVTQCTLLSNVSFGTITAVAGTATISTNSTNVGSGATGANDCIANSACQGMEINNTGNTNLAVNFTSNVNATTMLQGTGASNDDFQFATYNGTNTNEGTRPGCNINLDRKSVV